MSQALFVSQLANRVNSLGKLDAKNGLFNWPLDALAQEILPAGTILIWSGVVADIPKGWQLCDGTNGTPDLRARFVMGGGGSVNVGTTGGTLNFNLSLTESNLPAHTHSLAGLTTDTAGSHTHVVNDPGHSHILRVGQTAGTLTPQIGGWNFVGTFNAHEYPNHIQSAQTNISITAGGGHTHSFPASITGSTGTGTAVSIPTTPPYYALCYIMRLPYSGANSLEFGPSAPGLGGSGSGIDSWTVESVTGGLLLRITGEDLTSKDIKLTAGNNIQLVRNNAGELTISSTVTFDFEGAWSAKKTTDLPEASPARYWTPVREAAVTTYTDENDYLNFFPTAGVLKENRVPIYADFKFSINAMGMPNFWLTDNQNFDVAYYHVITPYGLIRPYRGYRFSLTNPDFIYDTEPLEVGFRTADEYLMNICNIGTYFAFVCLGNRASPSTRKYWLVKTFASSKSLEWEAYADVTSLAGATKNLFLMLDPVADRILQVELLSNSGDIILRVYDSGLTLLRTQQLMSPSELDATGLENPTVPRIGDVLYYARYGGAGVNFSFPEGSGGFMPFTWNKYTEELIFNIGSWLVRAATPTYYGISRDITVSWQVPRQWLLDGTGTAPTNNITAKGGGKRYILNDDAQTNSETSGVSTGTFGGAGWMHTVVTDEYARRITLGATNYWSTRDFYARQFPHTTKIKSFNDSAIAKYKLPGEKYTAIPDASAWSKIVNAYQWHIIDNNMAMSVYSNSYGWRFVSVDIYTNKFETRPPGQTTDVNNTIYLDPTTSKFVPSITSSPAGDGGDMCTTVIAGVGYYYRIRFNQTPTSYLQTVTLNMTASGNERVFTNTSLLLPTLPTTIGGVTNISDAGPKVFEGNLSAPVFWVYVKGTGTENNQLFIAKYSGGVWSINGPFHQDRLDIGNTSYNDRGNRWYASNGNCILTESKKLIVYIGVAVVSGTVWHISYYDTTTPSVAPTVEDPCRFNMLSTNAYGPIGGCNGYHGLSFGYSSVFGYYAATGSSSYLVTWINSSKSLRTPSSPVRTEAQWWTSPASNYEINFSAEATTGLFIYMRNFPLFVGGYYGQIPNTTVSVPASTTSWVYAIKPDPLSSRRDITIDVLNEYQPSSFRQVNLGSVTTLSDKITGSEAYTINPDTWEPPTGLSTNRTFIFTGRKATGNDGTFDLCVIRGLTVNGTIELAINFAATAGLDKGSYQRGTFAIGTYVNSGSTGLYTIEAGTPVNRVVTGTPFTYTRIGVEALKISWNGTGLSYTDTNFALYLRINTNMFLTINRLGLDG